MVVVILELAVCRTGVFRRAAYWISMVIVFFSRFSSTAG